MVYSLSLLNSERNDERIATQRKPHQLPVAGIK